MGAKKKTPWWALILAIAFVVIFLSICDRDQKTPSTTPTTTKSPSATKPSTTTPSAGTSDGQTVGSLEYQLALINVGRFVPEDDLSVAQFRYLLRTIESKTFNTQQEIADMTVLGQKLLRAEYGKEVKLLELMEAANDSILPDYKMKYAEVMAALVVLTGNL